MALYTVTEIFTVGIRIENIEANSEEEEAQYKFLEISEAWNTEEYSQAG